MANIKFREQVLSFLKDVRLEDKFVQEDFDQIIGYLNDFVRESQDEKSVSKDMLLTCMYLASELSSGNENMSLEDQEKLEEASIDIEVILSKLE